MDTRRSCYELGGFPCPLNVRNPSPNAFARLSDQGGVALHVSAYDTTITSLPNAVVRFWRLLSREIYHYEFQLALLPSRLIPCICLIPRRAKIDLFFSSAILIRNSPTSAFTTLHFLTCHFLFSALSAAFSFCSVCRAPSSVSLFLLTASSTLACQHRFKTSEPFPRASCFHLAASCL